MDNLLRLQEIFRDILDEPTLTISEEFSMADHEDWDSVATVQIVLAAENAFNTRLPSDAVGSIRKVKDILEQLPA